MVIARNASKAGSPKGTAVAALSLRARSWADDDPEAIAKRTPASWSLAGSVKGLS